MNPWDKVTVLFEEPEILSEALGMPEITSRTITPPDKKGLISVTRTHPTTILEAHCSDCIFCLETCPNLSYDKDNKTMVLNETACKGCGLCMAACPTGAMQQRNCWFGKLKTRISTLLGAERYVPDHCNQCPVRTVELCGLEGTLEGLRPVVRVLCSGRMEPGVVLEALVSGCDGVFVVGCLHQVDFYKKNEGKVQVRKDLLNRLLTIMGLSTDKVGYDLSTLHDEGCKKALEDFVLGL